MVGYAQSFAVLRRVRVTLLALPCLQDKLARAISDRDTVSLTPIYLL